MALVGVVGAALATIAIGLHVDAGVGLPSDAARALSVQLPITAIGLVLALHRPHNRLGPLALAAGATLGLSLAAVGILRQAALGHGVPVAVSHLAFAFVLLLGFPLTVLWFLALLAFPEGTPPTAGTRRWVAAAVATHAVVAVGAYLTAARDDLPGYLEALDVPVGGGPFRSSAAVHDVFAALNNVFLLALPACGVAALVVLQRHAGPVRRQQLRWLLPALGLQLGVHLAVPTSADPWHGWRAAGELAVLAAPAVGAAAIAVAVFKYRLWEIDAVISKALVFALLSAVVTAVFVVAGFGAAVLVGGANGRVLTALAVVLAAVVVSQGPRRRAERAVRRLVYGDRPHGYAVLGGLGDSLASAHDAGEAADRVVDAVQRGLSVPWAAVWLYVEVDGRRSLRPLSAGGIEVAPLELSEGVARALAADPTAGPLGRAAWSPIAPLVGDEPAAAAPLVAGADLVGLVACGDRFREPLETGDYELLGLLAREASLGLVNQRLVTELRFRLEELARSRQRLVNAQDAERRRVERDLHDGVQAQLVALAVQLRQIAARPADATSTRMTALATEAEEALFALQDLARGIYPSVLTDQGLPAALWAQAARMPVDVKVRVEPALISGRLPADMEAALYFVALEALGNAQKHAVDARVCAGLRLDALSAVLEVTDDGPGFDTSVAPASGQGLENMMDRMLAIGGTLTVRSELGSGSCVSAKVSLPPGWPPAPSPHP
ncbi:MAG: histidine kinase [Acidimicrobiales bacterium]